MPETPPHDVLVAAGRAAFARHHPDADWDTLKPLQQGVWIAEARPAATAAWRIMSAEPTPTLPAEWLATAEQMRIALGLPPGMSLLGIIGSAYLAGWQDHVTAHAALLARTTPTEEAGRG